jgi:hypothetical protein
MARSAARVAGSLSTAAQPAELAAVHRGAEANRTRGKIIIVP